MPNTSPIISLRRLLIAAVVAAVPSGASAKCHGQDGEWTLDELREATALLKQFRSNDEKSRDTLGTVMGSVDFHECNGLEHDAAVYEATRDRGIWLLKRKFKERDDAEVSAKPK